MALGGLTLENILEELSKLLEWAGYEIVEHRFFNTEFGRFALKGNNIVKLNLEKNSKQNL